MITLDDCVDLDRSDPLSEFRRRFDIDDGLVYLDGNSLGPPVRTVKEMVRRLLDQWETDLIRGWFDHGWAELPARVGSRIEPIVGAEAGSIVACDSTSVNLYKMAMAACDLKEGAILTDEGNFPTDLYVLAEVARRRHRELLVTEPEELAATIQGNLAVVALTQVDFRTGRLHQIGAITASAHKAGALALWDLSHSAGVMPIDLAGNDVDLAVGCGYKYLNGGPGAPAYLYVTPRLAGETDNPITGWFGHSDPFLFSPEYRPAPGVDRMQAGTPNVLSLVALHEALSVFGGVDLEALREKSVNMTSLFVELCDQMLGDRVEVVSPRDGSQRGSHVTVTNPAAGRIMEDLIARGVIGDFRPPAMMRFGFAPLFNRYVDAWRAVAELAAVVPARV